MTHEINDSEIQIEGYVLFRNDSHNRMTGGCVIYISEDFHAELLDISNLDKSVWIMSVLLRKNDEECVITAVYYSPSTNKTAFLDFVEKWIEEKMIMDKYHIVCGDFNVNLMDMSKYAARRLVNLIHGSGMKQFVNEPTRTTEFSSTMIDLVWSNDELKAVVLDSEKITDHCTILIEMKRFEGYEKKEMEIEIIKGYTAVEFRRRLMMYDWDNQKFLDLDQRAQILAERMKETISTFVTVIKSDKKWCAWYNHDL